ncbi:MAG TPA: class I SAM-dependent methyltransferase [Burkholderiaceae bacterium]|nr:class I SAM-dependent methyltransferase [Burkholderiaceae bacterium]
MVGDLIETLFGAPSTLNVRCWDGSQLVGVAGAPTLVVRNRRALRRFIYSPNELGLARAYVSGDLDIEGDIYAALDFRSTESARPDLELDKKAMARLIAAVARLGVIGPPPKPPAEESKVRGALHSLRRDRAAVSYHYDVGNDFYALLLGSSMVYSCAYFDSPSMSLDDAQSAKLELVCRKLELVPGTRMLDVGCGWGSLAIHAARTYGVHVVGVTISAAQAAFARARVAASGLDHLVEIRLQDYREVAAGPYDAISSVGMAEHVGLDQLPRYAAILHGLLAPGGRLLNHAIARGPAAGVDKPHPKSFLARYVCPDGELQPLATHVGMLETAGFEVRDVEVLREHYALTCRAWVHNLEQHWDDAIAATSPGRARVWRLYLAGSALGFEQLRVGVNQVLAVKAGGVAGPSWLRRPAWGQRPTGP